MTTTRQSAMWTSALAALALITVCVVVRMLVQEGALPYNFAAVGAAAMIAGYAIRSRLLAFAVPVLALLVSNVIIGGYAWSVMLVVYAALVLPVVLGRWIGSRGSRGVALAAWMGGGAVASSIVFFILTNSAVWAFTPLYDRSLAGLVLSYVAALPFFKWTLASNLIFTTLFGGCVALSRWNTVVARPASALAR